MIAILSKSIFRLGQWPGSGKRSARDYQRAADGAMRFYTNLILVTFSLLHEAPYDP